MATSNVLLAAQVLGVKVVFCGLEAAGADVAGALEVSLSLPIKFPDADRALEWAEMDILQAGACGGAAPAPLGLQALAALLGLAESDRQPLMGILELRSYQQGQTIFQRGDSGAEMVFILQGGADVRIPGFNGRDVRVALYRQGSMVGEMGFLDGQPRSATVTAVSDLSVAVLHRSAFDAFAANYPAGSRQILMHLAMELNSRLRRTNRIL
jgi:hypothetical protein